MKKKEENRIIYCKGGYCTYEGEFGLYEKPCPPQDKEEITIKITKDEAQYVIKEITVL